MGRISSLLKNIDHRPFPLPETAWVMKQSWSSLLFAHWPMKSELLRKHIPAGLEIDVFDGAAWLGVVPFAMRNVCPRYVVEIPYLSNFLELNIRTYVVKDGAPGVFFFSLDCSNPIAVLIARQFYHLPYFNARMKLSTDSGAVEYQSIRAGSSAAFYAKYGPSGPVFSSNRGSLESFLTERYCLYTTDKNGNYYKGTIHHDPWPLQPAEAEIKAGELVEQQLGIKLPDTKPLLHYSEHLDTLEWALELLN